MNIMAVFVLNITIKNIKIKTYLKYGFVIKFNFL